MDLEQQLPWVQLRELRFRRQGRAILDGISLGVRSAELILLTGPNGIGKSTLLRIFAGLQKPDRVQVDYHEGVRSWGKARTFLLKHICYLHQQPYLFTGSVYENVAYGLRRQRLPRSEVDERVHQALDVTSLAHLKYRPSHQLSGGEQQRVAIARAWVLAPRLMLLDEPVANLDKTSRRQCYELINRLQMDGISVILTSHEPQQGDLSITRHIHLYGGELIHKSGPRERGQVIPLASRREGGKRS